MRFGKKFLWVVIASVTGPVCGQIDYFSRENILRFADHLYASGDYLAAATEYQRYAYLQGLTDSLRYRIAVCRQRGGETELALMNFHELIDKNPTHPLSDRARYQIAYIYSQQGRPLEALAWLAEQSPHVSTDEAAKRMQLLTSWNRLQLRQWQMVWADMQKLSHQPFNPEFSSSIEQLRAAAQNGQKINYKSPTLAGIFSAALPGSGKMYAGRWNDGIYSLVLVGLFAYQAYACFKDDGSESIKPWLYTSIGSVFYLGNIYGSVLAVKIGNREKEQEVLAKVQLDLSWF